jgi:uncharacterized protein YggE
MWILALVSGAWADMQVIVFGEAEDSLSQQEFLRVELVISSTKTSLQSALAENQQVLAKVEAILDKAGISEKDREVSKFQVQPKYELIRKENTFQAHEVTQTVSFPCSKKDLDGGKLVDQLVEAGVLKVETVAWAQSEDNEVRALHGLYVAAVEDAREHAERMCAQAGFTVKAVQEVEEIPE